MLSFKRANIANANFRLSFENINLHEVGDFTPGFKKECQFLNVGLYQEKKIIITT